MAAQTSWCKSDTWVAFLQCGPERECRDELSEWMLLSTFRSEISSLLQQRNLVIKLLNIEWASCLETQQPRTGKKPLGQINNLEVHCTCMYDIITCVKSLPFWNHYLFEAITCLQSLVVWSDYRHKVITCLSATSLHVMASSPWSPVWSYYLYDALTCMKS